MTETPYDISEWATATTRGRHLFNYNARMTGTELRGWDLVKVATMAEQPGVRELVYLWQKKSGDEGEMIRVSIAECSDWRNAHQQLFGQLSHSMRFNIPRGSGKLAAIGDVNYVGQAPETQLVASVSFTRGNMMVSVRSIGDKPVDISSMARQLDRAFSAPPKATELEKGQAEDISPEPLTLKADQNTTLIDDLRDRAARGRWLKIIAPDGELSRESDALVYSPSQPGDKRIEMFAVTQ